MDRIVKITFVRHGESIDNCGTVWAGHRDSPLTNHGQNQALRVGDFFADTPISSIYTSDLKRAHSTALAIAKANKTSPTFSVTPLLREQFFGNAEGKPWDKGPFSGLPWEDQRRFRFENGESLEDVSRRADTFISSFLRPHISCDPSFSVEPDPHDHVVIVAHGIMIRELIRSLYKGQHIPREVVRLGGLLNTAWNRVEIKHLGDLHHKEIPVLDVRLICQNQSSHLEGLVRQKGGIGSSAYDEKQAKLTDFFAGGGTLNGHGSEDVQVKV